MDDSIYFSLHNEVEDPQQSRIAKLEKEKALIKEELDKTSNTFAVCLAIKNGKIKQLETAIGIATDGNKSSQDAQSETPSLRSLITMQMNTPINDWINNQCFAVTPCHDLSLTRLGDSTRPIGIIVFQNTSTRNLLFKIKAESREKFFVFPSCGRLLPGKIEVAIVIAHLKKEDPTTFVGEKIELKAILNDSTNFDEFRQLWSQTAPERRAQHDVFCLMAGNNSDQSITRNRSIAVDDPNESEGIQDVVTTTSECDQLKIRILEVEEELARSKSQSDEYVSIIRVLQEENAESTQTMETMKTKMDNMKRTLERYGHFSH